ncbi:MAG: hypothetical protein NTX29_13145 [Actinobacteria bacterium]|nr:hypothetical protein [Actinomycetota bacterium]
MSGADEGEGLLTLDDVLALIELESAERVVDRRGQADLDAADRVDDALEPTEVDEHEVADIEAAHLIDGLDRATGAAQLDRLIEAPRVAAHLLAVLLAGRQVDDRVARDAHADSRLPVAADVQDDDRVGALGRAELVNAAEAAVAPARARVAAHQDDV